MAGGGAERVVSNLLGELAARYEVHLVLMNGIGGEWLLLVQVRCSLTAMAAYRSYITVVSQLSLEHLKA